MAKSSQDETNELIAEYKRRLHLLKLRQAREGDKVDPSVFYQIKTAACDSLSAKDS